MHRPLFSSFYFAVNLNWINFAAYYINMCPAGLRSRRYGVAPRREKKQDGTKLYLDSVLPRCVRRGRRQARLFRRYGGVSRHHGLHVRLVEDSV